MKFIIGRFTHLFTIALILGAMWISTAAAQSKPNVFDGGNRWEITYFNDPTGDHQQWATQALCFLPYSVVGTSIQGAWYSLTFPDWNGRYYQEGDEVKMTGDYANDVGHDHMTLFHTTFDGQGRGMAFKDWTEWREDGAFGRIIGWGNTRMTRTGDCRFPQYATVADLEQKVQSLSREVPQRLLKDGITEAQAPGDEGQESLDTYFTRTGQK
ncbi:MAG: hypothetical protein ACI9SP_004075 [Arenicella sp.]|jgi:hypothetical protein